MNVIVSQITGNLTVCPTLCSGYQQSKHQRSTLLALCEGNPPVTGGFPSQRASNAESVFMPWCCHVFMLNCFAKIYLHFFNTGDGIESWNPSLMSDKDIDILHSHYLGCWSPDDAQSQGMSSNGIDLVLPGCSGLNLPEGLKLYHKISWNLSSCLEYLHLITENIFKIFYG